ncbi:tubby-related protein 4-like [Tachypleus tridentatus]|uniref:tubby-related protein 4-like n=1 Tax=Tachypleus tridentatus TaxID=6853 RepID=UPI003FCEE713
MFLHFEHSSKTQADCKVLSLTWMGKVPDELPDEDGWKLNRLNYYQDGWLATGNTRGVVGVSFTSCLCRKTTDLPSRTNYNLRGHRSEVTLVKWNEPYQKLASCDSSGIIFVWIKYEGRWSIELINDRNTQVTDFAWSHDGRMALICYQDGFVLVGSVTGQRYWSSNLNLGANITCGIWAPDDQQVLFGTSSGQILVTDVHGEMVGQVRVQDGVNITFMAWSCEKFKMEETDEEAGTYTVLYQQTPRSTETKSFFLAVCFQNGTIYIMKNYDDVSPIIIVTGLKDMLIEWSNNGDLLAVAGIKEDSDVQFKNCVHFYTDSGSLRFSTTIPYTQSPVSAITWGHNDKRFLIATGNVIHIGWVTKKIASLQLLSCLSVQNSLMEENQMQKLPLPRRLKILLSHLFSQTIKCYLPDPQRSREFVSQPPTNNIRLHCTMVKHDDDILTGSATYTLFLEYLGGLVPLLKGKRTSKLRPEFVIFDPKSSGDGCHRCSSVQSPIMLTYPFSPSSSCTASLPTSSDSEVEEGCASPRMQRRRKQRRLAQQRDGETTGFQHGELLYLDDLPETEKIVAVTSNIWGTKFKILSLAKWLPAVLGTITYRTSLLHLQPRQMTLVIKELLGPQPCDSQDQNSGINGNNSGAVVFSEDEDEVFDMEALSCKTSAPVAPMTPHRRNSHPPQSSSISSSGHFSGDAGEYVNFFPTEEFLTLETTSEGHIRVLRLASAPEEASSVAMQTNCQCISELSCDTNHNIPSTQLHNSSHSPHVCGSSIQAKKSKGNAISGASVPCSQPTSQNGLIPTANQRGNGLGSNSSPTNNKHLSDHVVNSNVKMNSSLGLESVNSTFHVSVENFDSSMNNGSTGKNSLMNKETLSSPGNLTDSSASSSPSSGSEDRRVRANKKLNNSEKGLTAALPSCVHSLDIHPYCKTKTFVKESSKNGLLHSLPFVSKVGDETYSSPVILSPSEEVVVGGGVVDAVASVSRVGEPGAATSKWLPSVHSGSHEHIPRWADKAGDIKFIDEDTEDLPTDVHLVRSSQSSPASPVVLLGHGSRSIGHFPTTEGTVNRDMWTHISLRDSQARLKVHSKPLTNSLAHDSDLKLSSSSRCDTLLSSNQLSAPGTTDKLTCKCNITRVWCPLHSKCSSSAVSHHDQEAFSFDNSKCLVTCPSVAENKRSASVSPPPSARIGEHRSSLPQAILVDNQFPSSPTSKSIPTSPIMRRRARSLKKGLLSSPLLLRKARKEQSMESSEDEGAQSGEELGKEGFKDLQSLQKAYIRKKLKKSRTSRSQEVADGTPGCGSSPYRDFILYNKAPLWNEVSQVYQLDFGGRVTQESAKNFQIEFRGNQVMQFGRIDGNAYTLDFQYPFCALQAFAVALANVTQRLK